MNMQFSRSASIIVNYSSQKVFPLLCPKMEEKWIPGWECQVIYSQSGYNEKGAVFKTSKAFGAEFVWFTQEYDSKIGCVEFILFAPDTLVFKFSIGVHKLSIKSTALTFFHEFISLGEDGDTMIHRYETEDYQMQLKRLGGMMESYLQSQEK